jgi:transglutaminase-like putative cysteine protease
MTSSWPDQAAVKASRGLLQEDWLLLGTTYAIIVSGALLLAVAERTLLYMLAVSALCAGHALLVGPNGPAYLGKGVAKFLAVGGLALGLLQSQVSTLHVSYGLAHFLMCVQVVELYSTHDKRGLRLIQIATIFVVLVAGIWALDIAYLPAFVLVALSLMANSMAITMLPPDGTTRAAPARLDDYGSSLRQLAAGLWLPALAALAATVLFFVLLPRARLAGGVSALLPQQLTGFSENVTLQDVGRMRESQRIALTARFHEAVQGEMVPIAPRRALLRGISLPIYRDGQWLGYTIAQLWALRERPERSENDTVGFSSRTVYNLRDAPVETVHIRQRITVGSRPIRTLFALYRPIRVEGGEPYGYGLPELDHSISIGHVLEPDDTYEVMSLVPRFTPAQLAAAGAPRQAGPWPFFWDVPDDVRPALERTAREIERLYRPHNDYERVDAVQRCLLESGGFAYTYDIPDFGEQEPLAAFLTDTRRGSCEQFSSAMALLLRVWGIPTRLVVGFKGGDVQDDGSFVFRDKDAHAWVEVFFNGLGWVEFDPTPGASAPPSQAQGIAGSLEQVADRIGSFLIRIYGTARAQWGANVIGYSRAKQRRLLSGISAATVNLGKDAASLFRNLWPGMPDLGLVQVVLLVASMTFVVMGVYLGGQWLQRRARRLLPFGRTDRTLGFYRQFIALLRRKGLRRPPESTPRELARLAAEHLTAGSSDPQAVVGALASVTDLFCRARYGGRELSDTEWRRVQEALRVLSHARPAKRRRSTESGPPS